MAAIELTEYFGEMREEAMEKMKELAQPAAEFDVIRKSVKIAVDTPYKILDEVYDTPRSVIAYLDLRSLEKHESARVGMFIGIRGKTDKDMVQIASSEYDGPVDDAVVIGPVVAYGRTLVTYRQLAGESKPIQYQLYVSTLNIKISE